jgi:hypothetical protein
VPPESRPGQAKASESSNLNSFRPLRWAQTFKALQPTLAR